MSKNATALSRHYPAVLRLCERMLDNRDDAADAAQETFRRALHQPEGSIADPGRWLRAVARNVCRDELRRRRAGATIVDDGIVQTVRAAEPELVVLGGMFVGELLDQLTAAERRVVSARLIDDRATHELAASLGIAPATTRVLLARGLGRLRRYLAETPGRLGGAGVAHLPAIRSIGDRVRVLLGRLRASAGAAGPRTHPFGEGIAIGSAALLTLLAHPSPGSLGAPPAALVPAHPDRQVEALLPATQRVVRSLRGGAGSALHGAVRSVGAQTVSGLNLPFTPPRNYFGGHPVFPGQPAPPSLPPITVGTGQLPVGTPITVTVCLHQAGC